MESSSFWKAVRAKLGIDLLYCKILDIARFNKYEVFRELSLDQFDELIVEIRSVVASLDDEMVEGLRGLDRNFSKESFTCPLSFKLAVKSIFSLGNGKEKAEFLQIEPDDQPPRARLRLDGNNAVAPRVPGNVNLQHLLAGQMDFEGKMVEKLYQQAIRHFSVQGCRNICRFEDFALDQQGTSGEYPLRFVLKCPVDVNGTRCNAKTTSSYRLRRMGGVNRVVFEDNAFRRHLNRFHPVEEQLVEMRETDEGTDNEGEVGEEVSAPV